MTEMAEAERLNLVLSLAWRAFQEDIPPDLLEEEAIRLVSGGLRRSELHAALQVALGDSYATPLLEIVSRLCTFIATRAGQLALAARLEAATAEALERRPDDVSLALALQHYHRVVALLNVSDKAYVSALVNGANVQQELAKRGIEPLANLKAALKTYSWVRERDDTDSARFGRMQLNEAAARQELADLGESPLENLEVAAVLYLDARARLDPGTRDHAVTLMNAGNVRMRLAELGVAPEQNLRQALTLYQESRWGLEDGTASSGRARLNEAGVRILLAERGVEAVGNLEEAVTLCRDAYDRLDPASRSFRLALGNEATARHKLASLGVGPVENLQEAILLYQRSRDGLRPDNIASGRALLNEATARRKLAALGLDPEQQLRAAVSLCQASYMSLKPDSMDYAKAQSTEAAARISLAEFGREPKLNLNHAITLCREACAHFPPQSPSHGRARTNEALARQRLADRRVAPISNLRQAVRLYGQARGALEPGSPDFGLALVNEAVARRALACLGREANRNLCAALQLCHEAFPCFAPGSPAWGIAQRNQAHVLHQLKRSEEAYQLLKNGLDVVEHIRARMIREHERVAFLETVAQQYAEMVSLCLDLGGIVDGAGWRWEAWHWVHRSKSRALLDLLATGQTRLPNEEAPLWGQLEYASWWLDSCERQVQQRERLRHAAASPDQTASSTPENSTLPQDPEPILREARLAYDRARREISERLETEQELAVAPIPAPEDVLHAARMLARSEVARTVLAEFFLLGNTAMLVFLTPLWGNAPPIVERVNLLPGTVRRLADRWLAVTRGGRANGRGRRRFETSDPPPERPAAGPLLAEMTILVEPWVHHLDAWQATELVLSPHYLLNLLPWHAIPWRGGPLVERFPVAYLPSAALAGEIERKCRPLTPTAVLLGDPTGDLPGAEQEVAAVAEELNSAGIAALSFCGDAATTGRVLAETGAAGIVHFACHSRLEPADFLRSGMELADRRLTALEIAARLDLQQASLVYLSSCDSGQSVPGKTDELMALVRAFLQAGSPTVVASLWELDDDSGNFFAANFYHFWLNKRQTLVRAFQMAMLETRQLYPDPVCWAPFVLMGAWRTAVEVAV